MRDSRWGEAPWGQVSSQEGAGDEMPWGSGAAEGDVVNVYETANLIATGPVLSTVKYKSTTHRSA